MPKKPVKTMESRKGFHCFHPTRSRSLNCLARVLLITAQRESLVPGSLTQGTQYLQGTGLHLLLVPHPWDGASVCTLKGVLMMSWLGEVGTELTV